MRLRLKAMRAGVWFRRLPRIDRVLVDLTIRVVDNIHSITLAKSLLTIIRKMEGYLESNLSRALREIGLPLAQKLSLAAQKWGNLTAKNWPTDSNFVNFLTVMHINIRKTYKT